MKEENQCPVCKGTGYEKHTYIRDDGEEVSEQIVCELCTGTGKITNKNDNMICQGVFISYEEEMLREKRSVFDYSSWNEEDFY